MASAQIASQRRTFTAVEVPNRRQTLKNPPGGNLSLRCRHHYQGHNAHNAVALGTENTGTVRDDDDRRIPDARESCVRHLLHQHVQ